MYDIRVPRELFLNNSRSTLMSSTDHSARRRFKSNTPVVYSGGVRAEGGCGWNLNYWQGGCFRGGV